LKVPAVILAGIWLAANASGVEAGDAAARHTTAAQTIRGTVSGVTGRGFTLLSPSKGAFAVSVSKDTKISGGRLRSGDHVGVHGFVHGTGMVAISVRIYPSKAAPKTHSVRGVVSAIRGSVLDIRVGRTVVQARLSSATVVRIGSKLGRAQDVHPGDRVEVRLLPGTGVLSAVHVHVYRQKTAGRSVELSGKVTSASSSQIALASNGKRYQISLSASTKVYVGRKRMDRRAIQTGMHARVFSCCAGGRLAANSIHLSQKLASVKQVTIHGLVKSLGRSSLELSASATTVLVSYGLSTSFEVGSQRVGSGSLHVLDYISVRGARSGSQFVATRIHIYLEYRRALAVSGTVVAVSPGRLVLLVRGKRTVVAAPAAVHVKAGSGSVALTSLHAGDRVTGTARLEGPGNLHLLNMRLIPPKVTTIRGVVQNASVGRLDVLEKGKLWRLLLGRVRPSIQGSPAPTSAIFPGVRLTARGTASGSSLRAASVMLQIVVRTVSGRVTSLRHSIIQVQASRGRTVAATLTGSTSLTDAGKRIPSSSLTAGTFVQLKAFEATPKLIHAVSIQVQHPLLSFTATVLRVVPQMSVRETNGEIFALNIGGSTPIVTSVGALPVHFLEIPIGVSVRVSGRADSYGAVDVRTLAAHLHTRTIRGKLLQIGPQSLQVQLGTQVMDTRVSPGASFLQGSHAIDAAGLVTGDDITVYGYDTLPGKMIARKVVVHRRIAALSGQISSLTDLGFVLSAADGQHEVILSDATVWTRISRAALAVGLTVHVTGYLRGDGSVIATRVRLGK
jgi:Domain of unknown function (DUF5666)